MNPATIPFSPLIASSWPPWCPSETPNSRTPSSRGSIYRLLLTTKCSPEKVYLCPFCFLTSLGQQICSFQRLPDPQVHWSLLSCSPGLLWAFDPVGFLPSGPPWFCHLLLVSSPFLPWLLPKLIPPCSSTLFIPLHALSYRGLTIPCLVLIQNGSGFSPAQNSTEPQTCLFSHLVGSFTCIFIPVCPNPTLLTFHPEVPPPCLFLINLLISSD